MWCDHPFSQRNMATERTVVGVGSDREVWGRTKFEKWGGGGENIVVTSFNNGISTPLLTM